MYPGNGGGCSTGGSATTACQYLFGAGGSAGHYELDAVMESAKFANGGSADVTSKDGGGSQYWYEVGNDLGMLAGQGS